VRPPVTVAGATLSTRPVVVPMLILLNAAVYVVTAVQAGSPIQNSTAALFRQWALWPPIVAANGEWWRLLTSGFLHYGLVHLGLNMFSLWIIGRQVELLLGRLRFATVYFMSLLGGGVSVFLFGGADQQVAGASGAVYGVMGGLAIAAFRLKINPGPVLGLIMLNVALSVAVPGISLLGHLGGLVVGALVTAGMVYPQAQQRRAWQFSTVVVLLAALVALIVVRDVQLGPNVCFSSPQPVCYRS
jgi:membrane associated rhomboid family serine protease